MIIKLLQFILFYFQLHKKIPEDLTIKTNAFQLLQTFYHEINKQEKGCEFTSQQNIAEKACQLKIKMITVCRSTILLTSTEKSSSLVIPTIGLNSTYMQEKDTAHKQLKSLKNTNQGLKESTFASHLRPISCNTAMNNEDGSKFVDPMPLMGAPFSNELSRSAFISQK